MIAKSVITIGTVLKPVGLRGELKVSLLTDFPERFKSLSEVRIETRDGEIRQYQIDHVRYGLPFVYLTFVGLSSIEQVSDLVGGQIQIPEEERIPLPEGSYYHFELQGLEVFLSDGSFLGKVDHIFQTGSNDVFVVKDGKKEILIPALRTVIQEINLARKRITIFPVEGLLE